MFRVNGDCDAKKDVSSFLDLGSLNVRYLQDFCLDAKNTFIRPRSPSPVSSDSSISHTFSSSPFSSSTPIPTCSICSMNMPKLCSQPSNYSQLVARSEVSGMRKSPVMVNVHPRRQQQQNTYQGNFNQQYNLHRIEAQQQQKNEISKSLKMFAMLAAYKYENDPIRQRVSPVDEIMQDFYCNGYVTDDSSALQQRNCEMETPLHKHCSPNNNDYIKNRSHNVNFNLNYASSQSDPNTVINDNVASSSLHYLNPNLWMFQLPSHSPYFGSGIASSTQQHAATVAAAAAATAAAFVNIDYNSTNIKKPQKRYGSTKFDKYSAVKHCVFCENNNEPEAVVKSHAVRDSLGRVLCPKLRTYICPICKASGDEAHTVKYCPQKPIITMEDAVKAESLRLGKNSYLKQGMKV